MLFCFSRVVGCIIYVALVLKKWLPKPTLAAHRQRCRCATNRFFRCCRWHCATGSSRVPVSRYHLCLPHRMPRLENSTRWPLFPPMRAQTIKTAWLLFSPPACCYGRKASTKRHGGHLAASYCFMSSKVSRPLKLLSFGMGV